MAGALRAIGSAVALLLLAACASPQGPSAGANVPNQAAFDSETGSIVGTITDDSLQPIAGAVVSLGDSETTTTDAAGGYAFSFVRPGTHTVHGRAPSYEKASVQVQVSAGASSTASLRLDLLPGLAPYFEARQQDGFIGCAAGTRILTVESRPAVCGLATAVEQSSVDRFRIDWEPSSLEDSSGVWAETSWEPSQASATGMFVWWSVLTSATGGPASTTWGVNSSAGSSPLRNRLPIETIEEKMRESPSPHCTLERCAWVSLHYASANTLGAAQPADATFVLQQRYTDYHTAFFKQDLPEDFSAVPD